MKSVAKRRKNDHFVFFVWIRPFATNSHLVPLRVRHAGEQVAHWDIKKKSDFIQSNLIFSLFWMLQYAGLCTV